MRLSQYLLPVLKEKPIEAQITSHTLMLRAGMIKQQSSGIYSWLPLGLRVMQNIQNIVRKNMNDFGCIELLMPCIQSASLWNESGRYDDYGKEMLRITDRHGAEFLFGPTNEEMMTDIFRSYIRSYKELPKNLYHIQWKFRDEIRPKFGVMRAREFLMKDAYSFDIDYESSIISYHNMYKSYMKTFNDIGVKAIPIRANTGAIGGNLSHEFHIVADSGESTLYYDKALNNTTYDSSVDIANIMSLYTAADEMHDASKCNIPSDRLSVSRGIEVGHIFNFGTKYSSCMGAMVTNASGELVPVYMGSYGIGISRLVAAVIEANHDDLGIIWPYSIAPFKVSLINLAMNNGICKEFAEKIYNALNDTGIDVIYDDSDARPGNKFATHDLIGSPWQIIVGPKNAQDGIIELKNRRNSNIENTTLSYAIEKIKSNL